MSDTLLALRDELRALSLEVLAAAALTGQKWQTIELDARYSADRTVFSHKVEIIAGKKKLSAKTISTKISECLTTLVRNDRGVDPFFGIKMIIKADKSVDVKLDYDPACFEDPSFYD
jgi:hypothetical protein